jgi:hypothetical protein
MRTAAVKVTTFFVTAAPPSQTRSAAHTSRQTTPVGLYSSVASAPREKARSSQTRVVSGPLPANILAVSLRRRIAMPPH